MSEIKKLTESIRDNVENLDYGTLRTLKMIENESDKLEQHNNNLKKEIEYLKSVITGK